MQALSTKYRSKVICVDEGRAMKTKGKRATRRRRRSELRRRRASIGVFLVWFWYRGSVLWFFFFFFFYKHSIGVCFAFALYRLYWGLVFSASDVTVGTVGLISDSLCWVFFFFFFWRIRGWVCFVGLTMDLACHGLGSITIFFFFGIFFFLKVE